MRDYLLDIIVRLNSLQETRQRMLLAAINMLLLVICWTYWWFFPAFTVLAIFIFLYSSALIWVTLEPQRVLYMEFDDDDAQLPTGKAAFVARTRLAVFGAVTSIAVHHLATLGIGERFLFGFPLDHVIYAAIAALFLGAFFNKDMLIYLLLGWKLVYELVVNVCVVAICATREFSDQLPLLKRLDRFEKTLFSRVSGFQYGNLRFRDDADDIKRCIPDFAPLGQG